MFILFLILTPFIIAQILVLWLETEFVIEYVELLRLDKIFKVFSTFASEAKKGSYSNFKEFLMLNYVTKPGKPVRKIYSFFVKLITCSICFSTMLSLIFCINIAIFVNWKLAIIIWMPLAYMSLFLYEKIKNLLK